VTIQGQILKLIRDLQKKKGMAVLLITHDMGVVAEAADDVFVMYAAQIMERGSVFQIFEKMAHPYTLGLFQSRPSLTTPRGKLQAIKGTVPPLTDYPKGCRFHPRCPFVMPKCHHGDVPNFVVDGAYDHLSKCWLYDGTEESLLKMQGL
jgi:peptide/nickel transport system ATP-binding protein